MAPHPQMVAPGRRNPHDLAHPEHWEATNRANAPTVVRSSAKTRRTRTATLSFEQAFRRQSTLDRQRLRRACAHDDFCRVANNELPNRVVEQPPRYHAESSPAKSDRRSRRPLRFPADAAATGATKVIPTIRPKQTPWNITTTA